MKRKPVLYLGATSLALVIAGGVGLVVSEHIVSAQAPARGAAQGGAAAPARGAAAGGGPAYRVNPLWPQPLQNHWVLGAVSGVAVDKQDHVWIVHRGADSLESSEKSMILNPPTSTSCCVPAPSVMEFDSAGRVMASWGGPGLGFVWPQSTGGIAVDGDGNIWIAAYGLEPAPAGGRGRGAADPDAVGPPPAARGGGDAAPARGRGDAPAAAQAPARGRGAAPAAPTPADAHITKYSPSGQQLLRIGTPGQPGGPDSQTGLNRPAGMSLDDAAHEVYVADSGNHRVAVFDSNTGAFKRSWGGSGDRPTAAGGRSVRSERRTVASVPRRDVREGLQGRHGLRLRSHEQPHSGVPEERPVHQGNGHREGNARCGDDHRTGAGHRAELRRLGVGHRVLERCAASGIFSSRTVTTIASASCGAIRSLKSGRSATADVKRVDSSRLAAVAVDSRGNLYTGEVHHAKRVQKFTPAAAAAAPATGH